MTIAAADLTGVDVSLARRILAVARSIAPIDTIPDGSPRDEAIAVLIGVAGEAQPRGSRQIKAQSVPGSSITYGSSSDWFSEEDRAALRALCGAGAGAGAPLGSFPAPGVIGRLWPESGYPL